MKLYLRLGSAAIVFAVFFSSFAAIEIRAQNILPEILKRMDEHNKALTSLQANVKMDKYNSQLDEPDVTEGTVKYLPLKGRDALIRIDWTTPVQETLAVVDKKYVLFTPRRKSAIVGNASNAKGNGKANNLFAFINMSKDELKANFNIKYLGQENLSNKTQTWHLEMTPKNAASFKFKTAEMWIDGNGMPIQIKVTESNKDTTTLLLSALQKNISIKTSVFKVNLPKGTNIIDG